MEFDFGDINTNEETSTTKKDVTSNNDKGINEFIKNLINTEEFEIKTNKKLLEKFEKFIENDFLEIVMNDEIFDEKQQVELVREIDYYKWGFLELINKPYLSNKLIISVSGRFSAGKSSLLNAILNTNLPVNVEATTAIPTYLTYYSQLHKGLIGQSKKDGNHMIVNSKCLIGKPKLMKTESLNYITKENIKNFPLSLSKLIDNFVISIRNSILKDKAIIDTPGIDPADKGTHDYDEEITRNSIALANVVFWIMDIDEGDLANISLQFLKENISENQDLVVIVNKIDKKPPKEVEKVLNQVKKTLGKHIKAKTLGVIPFSKKNKKLIENLKFYIKTLPKIDAMPEIIKGIDIYLQVARKIVVEKLLTVKKDLEFHKEFYKDIMENSDYEFLLKKYEGFYPIKTIKEIYEKNSQKWNRIYNKWLDLLKYDAPLFGDDKYYIYPNELDKFTDKVLDMSFCFDSYYIEKGYWLGVSSRLQEESKKTIEKLEALESKINNAINKFEELRLELKNLV